MSWDIFVQDIPVEATSVAQIPDDYEPGPIGPRTKIIEMIIEVVPDADFADPSWGKLDGRGYSIEVNLGEEETLESFCFHVRGGNVAACVVADILEHLKLRAFDPGQESGIFSLADGSAESMKRWREYRDTILGSNV